MGVRGLVRSIVGQHCRSHWLLTEIWMDVKLIWREDYFTVFLAENWTGCAVILFIKTPLLRPSPCSSLVVLWGMLEEYSPIETFMAKTKSGFLWSRSCLLLLLSLLLLILFSFARI